MEAQKQAVASFSQHLTRQNNLNKKRDQCSGVRHIYIYTGFSAYMAPSPSAG